MRLKVSNFAIGANVIVFFGLVSVSSGKENVKRLRLKRLSRREENSIGPKVRIVINHDIEIIIAGLIDIWLKVSVFSKKAKEPESLQHFFDNLCVEGEPPPGHSSLLKRQISLLPSSLFVLFNF